MVCVVKDVNGLLMMSLWSMSHLHPQPGPFHIVEMEACRTPIAPDHPSCRPYFYSQACNSNNDVGASCPRTV